MTGLDQVAADIVKAVHRIGQAGFDNVHNMEGGIVAWQQAGYDVER